MGQKLAVLAMALGLAGCRGLPVNVATPKPLEVDVTMRVDIYQHQGAQAAPAAPGTDRDTADEEARRRDRMAEVQSFKNSRLVGEDRTGLLRLMQQIPGKYGLYVEETVTAENADRATLMRAEAVSRRVPLATVEAERAEHWRERSFPGEWIEERQPDGSWRWVQKRATGSGSRASRPARARPRPDRVATARPGPAGSSPRCSDAPGCTPPGG